MPSQLNRALGRGKRKGLTHREVMQKRHEKRKKKEKRDLKHKKMDLLKEYKRLCKIDTMSKKDTARRVMDIIEEINEEGMNDDKYLRAMDMLMNLHKEEEEKSVVVETTRRVTRPSVSRNLYETMYYRDFYFDRAGDNRNLFNEAENIINRINEDINEANRINNVLGDTINIEENITNVRDDIIIDNTVRDGWLRTGQGTWRRTNQPDTPDNRTIDTLPTIDDY